MNTFAISNSNSRLFLWGFLITLVLVVPVVIAAATSFRGTSQQRATGLGAVAGGLSEVYALYGMVFTTIMPIVAIVLLAKSLSG
jgi:hypothetical protein